MVKTRDCSRDTHVIFYACVVIPLLTSVLFTDAHLWHHRHHQLQATTNGTSQNISEIFIGRCLEHKQCLQSDQCFSPESVDCESLWQAFLAVFQYKNPCNTPDEAYDDVIAMAPPTTPIEQANQTLFWSGLQDAALNVARVSKHYSVLEETLPGYIANRLKWCGDPDPQSDGINHVICPMYGTENYCDGDTNYVFLKAASREFARHASGKVSVALNISRKGGAFNANSTFATTELPNLDPKKIDLIEILLIPDVANKKPGNASEKCGSGTILILQQRIEARGMKWKCTTDPPEFRYIQCSSIDNAYDNPVCAGENGLFDGMTVIVIAVGSGLLLLIIVLVFVIVIMAKRLNSPKYTVHVDD